MKSLQKRTKGKYMVPSNNTNGYLSVSLSKNKNIKYFRIHRLVAQAFIPNLENKPQVNHKNGIKTDNRVENLEWCTNSENQKHAYSMGFKKANTDKARKISLEVRAKKY